MSTISFRIRGPERVALEASNGAGKSSLHSCIMGDLHPLAGVISADVPIARVDQDVRLLEPGQTVCENLSQIDPGSGENSRRVSLARFGFRAEAADLPVAVLSGGQRLRTGRACALERGTGPQLLLLNEPSDHPDIEATEALEAALCAYDGALLPVTHDARTTMDVGEDQASHFRRLGAPRLSEWQSWAVPIRSKGDRR